MIKSELVQQIAAQNPIRQLGDAVFKEKNAIAFDKSSALDATSLVSAVDDIVKAMHADGTLSALSMEWFSADQTQGLVE